MLDRRFSIDAFVDNPGLGPAYEPRIAKHLLISIEKKTQLFRGRARQVSGSVL